MDHDVTTHALPDPTHSARRCAPSVAAIVRGHLGAADGAVVLDAGDGRSAAWAVELFCRLCHRDGQGGADRAVFHARPLQSRLDQGGGLRGIFWLAIMLGLTFADYLTRGWLGPHQ